jgi:hypothetical protein
VEFYKRRRTALLPSQLLASLHFCPSRIQLDHICLGYLPLMASNVEQNIAKLVLSTMDKVASDALIIGIYHAVHLIQKSCHCGDALETHGGQVCPVDHRNQVLSLMWVSVRRSVSLKIKKMQASLLTPSVPPSRHPGRLMSAGPACCRPETGFLPLRAMHISLITEAKGAFPSSNMSLCPVWHYWRFQRCERRCRHQRIIPRFQTPLGYPHRGLLQMGSQSTSYCKFIACFSCATSWTPLPHTARSIYMDLWTPLAFALT